MPNVEAYQPNAKRRIIGRALRFGTLVFIITFIVRAYFLESFTVTTGSMAPLLLGVHRQCDCPKCGFPVVVGVPPADVDPTLHWQVNCPNCGQGNLGLENLPDRPGRWLLVDKNVFEWRSPRRWELVVFRGPTGNPYVKRVVGLPGESVQIKDGDVYVNGEIARKPFQKTEEMSFVVLDGRFPNQNWWALDSQSKEVPAGLQILATGTKSMMSIQIPDHRHSDFITDYCTYNGQRVNAVEPAFDFRFKCRLRMQGPPGTCMSIRLENGRGSQGDSIQLETPNTPTLSNPVTGQIDGLKNDHNHTVELVYYDGDYYFRLDDGRPILRFSELADFKKVAVKSPIRMVVTNADVELQSCQLFRDTHYQAIGRHGIKSPCRLGSDEYFVLGDNSSVSDDSRMWPEPGVKRSAIIGRPMR